VSSLPEDTEKEALKAILWSNGFVESNTEVASYAGSSKTDSAIVLGRFLAEKAPHVRLVVHRDRDYMSQQAFDSLEKRLTENNVEPLLTDGNDIESHFISAAHLNELNPMASVERIEQLIHQATTDTEQKSIAAIVNLRTEEVFKKRQAKDPPPNYGEIAVQAQTDYAQNTIAHRRGKLVLGRLTALLQREIGQNPRIFFPTAHLKSSRITAIAQAIWP
jgi:hypothetical protein